jgi:hypothetical protein
LHQADRLQLSKAEGMSLKLRKVKNKAMEKKNISTSASLNSVIPKDYY